MTQLTGITDVVKTGAQISGGTLLVALGGFVAYKGFDTDNDFYKIAGLTSVLGGSALLAVGILRNKNEGFKIVTK